MNDIILRFYAQCLYKDIGNLRKDTEQKIEFLEWLRKTLNIQSRSDLKTNQAAAAKFWRINEDFQLWTQSV